MVVGKLKQFLLLGSDKRDSIRRLKNFFSPEDLILDVGSLEAPYSRHLPNEVVAIDIPPSGIFGYSQQLTKDLTHLRPNFYPVFANAEFMPFKDSTFDKIICTELMEHVYNDDPAAKEMSRVLKTGGKVYITTPNGDALPLEKGIKEHVRHYTKKELVGLLSPYFSDIVQDTRFKSFRLMCLQYDLLNAWAAKKYHLWILASYFFVLCVCELFIRVEKFFPGEGYNQVIVCSGPIKGGTGS